MFHQLENTTQRGRNHKITSPIAEPVSRPTFGPGPLPGAAPLAVLHLLDFSALDLARWEACVAASPSAPPYVEAWWLAATASRWAAVVELGPGGEYRSLLPLPLKRRPWGQKAYQPLFTQQLGLVLTAKSEWRNLADYLEVVKKNCAQFYQQLPPAAEPLAALPTGFTVAERLTYHLDLGAAYTTLHLGYAADYRRRLRKNQEAPQPLRVVESADLEEIITLFLAYRGAAHTGLQARHYAPLRRLYAALQARNLAELRQVRHPATGELLAGALLVRHAGGIIYLFAAASVAGRAAGAPLLLVDDALRRHAGQPGRIFDFEGGNIPAIGRFFANFGARAVPYPTLTLTQLPWLFRWMLP